MRIVHITVDHTPLDVRVFRKECRTLAEDGHEVHLLVPDPPAEDMDAVRFHGVPKRGRLRNILGHFRHCWRLAFRHALPLRADVYHFHEVLSIPAGLLLRLARAKVVYDVHEDFPKQTLSLEENVRFTHRVISWLFSVLEFAGKVCFDAFVCATPAIARRFPRSKTVLVRNLPIRAEFPTSVASVKKTPHTPKPAHVVYVGGISVVRSAKEMVLAMHDLPPAMGAKLVLAGRFASPELEENLGGLPGWEYVDYVGWLGREDVAGVFARARVGLVLFHPRPNAVEAMPTKLFEYMAAGIPFVASDFPLWRNIGGECGLYVDPCDPRAIAQAIEYLLKHPAEAQRMGAMGREAVLRRYNWGAEAPKLLRLYGRLGPRRASRRYVQGAWPRDMGLRD